MVLKVPHLQFSSVCLKLFCLSTNWLINLLHTYVCFTDWSGHGKRQSEERRLVHVCQGNFMLSRINTFDGAELCRAQGFEPLSLMIRKVAEASVFPQIWLGAISFTPSLHSLSPLPFHKIQLGNVGSAVSFPTRVQDRASAADAFLMYFKVRNHGCWQ